MRNKIIIVVLALLLISVGFVVTQYMLIMQEYQNEINGDIDYNWRITNHPLYNSSDTIEFVNDGSQATGFTLWSKGVTGSVSIKVFDREGHSVYELEKMSFDETITVDLDEGQYTLEISCHWFTGAFAMSYDRLEYVVNFPNDRYEIVKGKDITGTTWDYILYRPEEIKAAYLLVSPNNTGAISDSMLIHEESAKGLCKWFADMADDLGVPLLVPIFPRPESHSDQYTHALGRAALLSDVPEYNRLDLQLISMIDHCKSNLKTDGIDIEDKILMFGFSASGDFVDRFTLLHPEMVKALAYGGSDNVVPLPEYNGVPLPYPLGTYDYSDITGRTFDAEAYKSIQRFIFKGSEDEGGWMRTETPDGEVVYTGKAYYEQFVIPELNQYTLDSFDLDDDSRGGRLEAEQLAFYKHKAFEGHGFVDLFGYIKTIHSDLNLDNHTFIIYDGIGHSITDDIFIEVINFLKNAIV